MTEFVLSRIEILWKADYTGRILPFYVALFVELACLLLWPN